MASLDKRIEQSLAAMHAKLRSSSDYVADGFARMEVQVLSRNQEFYGFPAEVTGQVRITSHGSIKVLDPLFDSLRTALSDQTFASTVDDTFPATVTLGSWTQLSSPQDDGMIQLTATVPIAYMED